MGRNKAQLTTNPKPNNIRNQKWKKGIDECRLDNLGIFCLILGYKSKGKSSNYIDFWFHYTFDFNTLHLVLGMFYRFGTLPDIFYPPNWIPSQH